MDMEPAARASDGMSGTGRRTDGLALLAVGLGCFFGVVVFLPPEGRIAAPLHDGVGLLLGHSSFLLPAGLIGLGVLVLLPGLVRRSRLAGVVVLTLAGLPSLQLLGVATGLVGAWLASVLLDWLGGPATDVVLLALLLLGCLLTFDVTLAQAVGCAAHVHRRLRPRTSRAEGSPARLIEEGVAEE